MLKSSFWALTLLSIPLWSYTPYYAGSILSFISETTPPGQVSLQLYMEDSVFQEAFRGTTREKIPSVSTLYGSFVLETGICKRMAVSLFPGFFYNSSKGIHRFEWTDTEISFGFQILNASWGDFCDLRIDLPWIIPTGRFEFLNPKLSGADASGNGSYRTGIELALKKYFVSRIRPYTLAFSGGIYFATEQVNFLDARPSGRTIEEPVNAAAPFTLFADLAGELSLTQNVVLALDVATNYQSSIRNRRIPSSCLLTLIPALEYNFTQNLSITGGVIWTPWGKNNLSGIGGVLSLSAVFAV